MNINYERFEKVHNTKPHGMGDWDFEIGIDGDYWASILFENTTYSKACELCRNAVKEAGLIGDVTAYVGLLSYMIS